MKDTDIQKLVIKLAEGQIQLFETLSALKDAHGCLADPFLHLPLEISSTDSAMILDHLKLAASAHEKLADHVSELQALRAALE